uniref:DUF4218 domain-containing protein n=1 Tax=Triticum urartu TaxID=4572 RepID=A0A8R7JVV6_TRIUA
MEKRAPELLCKLEKIFPPGFFNPMEHMILHLPSEVRMGGPVQNCWCYGLERMQKTLRAKCRNKRRIQASTAEAFLVEEMSNFSTSRYAANIPSLHNAKSRYNTGDPRHKSKLSLFKGQLGPVGASVSKILDPKEWRSLTSYILTNLKEVRPCIDEFVAQFSDGGVEPDSLEQYELLVGEGDGNYGFISWFRVKGASILDKELKQVANGFDYKVGTFDNYDINGYRFRTHGNEERRAVLKTRNTGVSAICNGDFYRCEDGNLEEARAIVNHHCKKLVRNLMHEACPLAVRRYKATQGYRSVDKKPCRNLHLKKDEYMQVTPRWCVDKGECWERIVDYWCSEEYREKNLDYKNRRAAMEDPPHHQGNLNLKGFGECWASHNKALEPNLFVAYTLAHKGSF